MAEHVGDSQVDVYARSLFDLLRPGGMLLNHAIAALDPDHKPHEDIFSTRYVFPDGEPLPLARIQLALERTGFHTQHVEGFREDYSATLRHWSERLDQHLEEAEALAGRNGPGSGGCTCGRPVTASTPSTPPSTRWPRSDRRDWDRPLGNADGSPPSAAIEPPPLTKPQASASPCSPAPAASGTRPASVSVPTAVSSWRPGRRPTKAASAAAAMIAVITYRTERVA